MNKAIFIGRLTKDVETFTSGEIKGARYTLAVSNGKEADYIPCTVFGKRAEFAEKYLHKGVKIAVDGRISTGSYEKDGKKHYTWGIVVDGQEFAESKRAQEEPADVPEGIDAELPWGD